MNGPVLTALEVCLPAVLFFFSLMTFALSDFSRSTLEELFEERGRLDRFTKIIHRYERALLLCQSMFLCTLILSTVLFVRSHWFEGFELPFGSGIGVSFQWAMRWLVLLAILASVFTIIPWTISRVRGERLIVAAWPVLAFLMSLTSPLWRAASSIDRAVHRVAGLPDPDSSAANTILEEELRTVVDEGQREGILQGNASRMIHRVVDLQNEDVAAIMTPRTEMVTIPAATPLHVALDMVVEQNYSRIPVTGQSIDDIVGILYARDLLAQLHISDRVAESRTVGEIAREVLFVPESQRIELLLEHMQQRKVHLAIVVDEYSGVSGLVTLEDILEEIVGEIADEHDDEEEPLFSLGPDGTVIADGRVHIDELNREYGFEFPEDEEYDTIGGFVMAELARIPAIGESIDWHGTTIEVTEADERQLKRVVLTRTTVENRRPN